MNRWKLTDEVRLKYLPQIVEHIGKIEISENPYDCELDLTGTELNPYTLWKLLEELEYKHEDTDTNGWEMDFWLTFNKKGCKPIQVRGTGILCKFYLGGVDE